MGKALEDGATMERVAPSFTIRSRTGHHKPTITGSTHAWTAAKTMRVFQEVIDKIFLDKFGGTS